MSSLVEFLKRAADRNGFRRDRFEEKKIPTDFSNVAILPFFGDLRASFVLSSFLLKRYREEIKASKYFILASWPGQAGMFPFVDEYWSFLDEAVVKKFYENAEGLRNTSNLNTTYCRNLNEFFRDVVDVKDLEKYYRNGFTNYFFEKFTDTKRFLPFIPSVSIMGRDFNKDLSTRPGYKVFIDPTIFCKFWHNGTSDTIRSQKEFWVELCKFLLKSDVTPVVWQHGLAHSLVEDLGESCIFLRENDVIKALSVMRACSCVLDVMNGSSRYALMARTPFICVDERSRYAGTREYELDDLCAGRLPNQYIFTFSTILTEGKLSFWQSDIFQTIKRKLDGFLPNINKDGLPPTAESNEIVSYKDFVQQRKKKKLGTRFIKITHD